MLACSVLETHQEARAIMHIRKWITDELHYSLEEVKHLTFVSEMNELPPVGWCKQFKSAEYGEIIVQFFDKPFVSKRVRWADLGL